MTLLEQIKIRLTCGHKSPGQYIGLAVYYYHITHSFPLILGSKKKKTKKKPKLLNAHALK